MTSDLLIDVRLGDRLVVSPYAGYLYGATGSMFTCPGAKDSCGTSGVRVGGSARYMFARTTDVDVWAGYGFSRQWLAVTQTGASARFVGNDHHVNLGADFFVNNFNDTRLGVYLDVAMGRYDESSLSVAGAGTLESAEPGVHQWTTIGGQFVF